MRLPWFQRAGRLFRPIAWPGWILTGIAVVLAVVEFLAVDRHSHSASDTLINWFFRLALIGIGYSVVALATSRTR